MSTWKAMKLIAPNVGLMKCKVCGSEHIGMLASSGRYQRGAWQCNNGCTKEDYEKKHNNNVVKTHYR